MRSKAAEDQRRSIGLSIRTDRICGDLVTLEHDLNLAEKIGFVAVELPIHGIDVLCGGRLRRPRLREVKHLLDQFPFRITVHGPDILNLQDMSRWEIQQDLFQSCIDFSVEIGAELLVYHQGHSADGNTLLDREVERLINFGTIAAASNLSIGVENVNQPIFNLIGLIQTVGLKNVGITYDFGHDYLAANFFGYEFLTGLCAACPYIIHLHIHDNLGWRAPLTATPLATEEPHISGPFGEGDLHLPPSWGTIPYRQAFTILNSYEGILMLELHKRFFNDRYSRHEGYRQIEEALAQVEDYLAAAVVPSDILVTAGGS